jgi:exonuclease VII small subunit
MAGTGTAGRRRWNRAQLPLRSLGCDAYQRGAELVKYCAAQLERVEQSGESAGGRDADAFRRRSG